MKWMTFKAGIVNYEIADKTSGIYINSLIVNIIFKLVYS
jgi:hypothetical protein